MLVRCSCQDVELNQAQSSPLSCCNAERRYRRGISQSPRHACVESRDAPMVLIRYDVRNLDCAPTMRHFMDPAGR